jgi:hypothetical protein
VLLGLAFDEAFGGLAFAHQQRGRLGERPLQVGVADLLVGRAF